VNKHFCRTSIRQHFFGNRIVDTWNALVSETVKEESLNRVREVKEESTAALVWYDTNCMPFSVIFRMTKVNHKVLDNFKVKPILSFKVN
jgi:hypothetical protein